MKRRTVKHRTSAKLEATLRRSWGNRRTVNWHTTLTTKEAAIADELRRGLGLNRAELIRWLIVKQAAFHKRRRPDWGNQPAE